MTRRRRVYKQGYNAALDLLRPGEALPSEPELGSMLGISRTTVRSILTGLSEAGLITWDKRRKTVLRAARPEDRFPAAETDSPAQVVERAFMRRLARGGVEAGAQVNELELAREVGVATSTVREFLIRFARFGLIEKRASGRWTLKGFTPAFALELAEIREMFELRSAQAFAALEAGNPAWEALARIEAEHRDLRVGITSRFREFTALDERFHRLVHSAARNRFIDGFYDVIAMVFHYHYQWNKAGERERNAAALDEHLDYIAALRSREPERVDAACRRHLASARRTLLESVPKAGQKEVERSAEET